MQRTRRASQQMSPLQVPCCCQMLLSNACVKVTNESCGIVCVLTGKPTPFFQLTVCAAANGGHQRSSLNQGSPMAAPIDVMWLHEIGPCQQL